MFDAVHLAVHRYRNGDETLLDAVERSSIAAFAPAVREGMVAARCAARRLFRMVGVSEAVTLPHREGLAPLWPEGWHGSLAHCDSDGIGAIARQTDVAGVGVDIERFTVLDDATLAVFARPEEAAAVGDAQDRRLHLFCAKEAAYKAFRCQSGAWRDPHDIVISADFSCAAIRDAPAVALSRLDLIEDAVAVLAVLR